MKNNKDRIRFFQNELLYWHQEFNSRRHPWSEDKSPYKIWLSEIIMQQTRLEQGLPYYLRFVEKYPTMFDLAAAPDEEVFLLWQGLGYYNRCRNLLQTARFIAGELNGVFPSEYAEILKLKGVGFYTAAAIASFAFDLPFAVLDGNVFRLLARFQGIDLPIDSTKGKKLFQEMAQELLPKKEPAVYNQAVMDFGATVCTPVQPKCDICPLVLKCKAVAQNLVELLPVKGKKIKVKERYFQYLLLQYKGMVYLQQRQKKDIWQHLFEPYLVEAEILVEDHPFFLPVIPFIKKINKNVFQSRQRLTHQLIISQFHIVELKEIPEFLQAGIWVKPNGISSFAFPKTVLLFLKESNDGLFRKKRV